MPPAERNNTPSRRTQIPPAKVAKVERTHEENQERAYIAASRRSDRSLEARVESARRASEIHKRRTGRSLRVTEQDVVNEEMYEEEEDDLPMQYRRLAAHLQTGQHNFDRRLSEYLSANLGMRSMWAQQNPSAGIVPYHQMPLQQQQFSYPHQSNNSSMFPPQMMGQQMPRPQQQSNAQTTYRTAPYPHQRPHQQDVPTRRQSVPTTQGDATQQHNSTVAPLNNDSQSSVATTMAMPQTPQDFSEKTPSRRPSFAPGSFSTFITSPDQAAAQVNLPHQYVSGNPSNTEGMGTMSNMGNLGNLTNFGPEGVNYSPFSNDLPTNVQQFGPAFDPNDTFISPYMNGHDSFQDWNNYNTSFSESSHPGKHTSRGMNSMLSRSYSQVRQEDLNNDQTSLDRQEPSNKVLNSEDAFDYEDFLHINDDSVLG